MTTLPLEDLHHYHVEVLVENPRWQDPVDRYQWKPMRPLHGTPYIRNLRDAQALRETYVRASHQPSKYRIRNFVTGAIL